MKIKVQRRELEFDNKNRIFYNGACYQFANRYSGTIAKSTIKQLIKDKKIIECECPSSYKGAMNGVYERFAWYKINE